MMLLAGTAATVELMKSCEPGGMACSGCLLAYPCCQKLAKLVTLLQHGRQHLSLVHLVNKKNS